MIPLTKPYFDKQDEAAIINSFQSSFVSGDGPECRLFEKELSNYLGVKHAFFVNSCTAALDLAYLIKEFPVDSEVLVPNFTFTSTALAPIINNLKVVLVDVNPENGNIDLEDARKKITSKTVAISPVDYAGNPVDIKGVLQLANDFGLFTVHDAAQSIGSEYNGLKIGNFCDVTCFSFHGTKNLVVGEGGAIVTNDDKLAEKLLIARDKGTDKHLYLTNPQKSGYYEYVAKGNSYVQSNILGALGRTQLKKIDFLNSRRTEIATEFNNSFCRNELLRVPKITDGAKTNWHLYYILVDSSIKLKLINLIKESGVSANVHYNPLHLNKFYSNLFDLSKNDDLKNSIKFYDSLVRIPLFPSLSNLEVKKIIEVVNDSLNKIIS